MAHQWSSPPPIIPFVPDYRYSSLHHERSYLLSALAAEESRAEHLICTLETTMAKLKIVEAQQDSAEAVGYLKRAAASISRKLKKCHKNERAMANNLAATTARMQMLEQHRWRKAQFEYSQSMQQMQIYGMVPQGLPNMAASDAPILPPPAYGYSSSTPHYLPATYPLSPLSVTTLPPTPATPMPQPQSIPTFLDNTWNAPRPLLENSQPPFFEVDNTPFNTAMPTTWLPFDSQSTTAAFVAGPSNAPTSSIRTHRRMSLPNPPRRSSWHTLSSSEVERDRRRTTTTSCTREREQ